MATNISGIIAFALHLFLRQSSSTTSNIFAIGPSRASATPRSKQFPPPPPPPPSVVVGLHGTAPNSGAGSSGGGGGGGGGEVEYYPPVQARQSRCSASTVTSLALNRMGEEITGLMITLLNSTREHSANLRQLESPTPRYTAGGGSSPPPPRPPLTAVRGLHTRLRPASAASTVSATSFTFALPAAEDVAVEQDVIEPLSPAPPARTRTRKPNRPSRSGVAPVNVEREQDLGTSVRREGLIRKVHSHTRTASAMSLFEAVQNTSPKLGVGGSRPKVWMDVGMPVSRVDSGRE